MSELKRLELLNSILLVLSRNPREWKNTYSVQGNGAAHLVKPIEGQIGIKIKSCIPIVSKLYGVIVGCSARFG